MTCSKCFYADVTRTGELFCAIIGETVDEDETCPCFNSGDGEPTFVAVETYNACHEVEK